ncbi:MAG: FAD-dependent oxidoreductase, partial [Vicinamibacterales bacterium]
KDDRELGMGVPIPHRDFLNGVAIGIAGAYAGARSGGLDAQSAALAPDAANHPPSRTGLRGEYPAAVDGLEALERGTYATEPRVEVDTREHYDVVIVGAGISGLSAAYFWRQALGSDQRVLILDNHDDFGGHAKRNELTYQGRTFIGYGGTMSISTPYNIFNTNAEQEIATASGASYLRPVAITPPRIARLGIKFVW